MAELERSESLQRDIRKGGIPEIGIPTWTLAKNALKAGNLRQAEKLIDHGIFEVRQVHDVIVQTTAEWLEYIVKNLGEEHVARLWSAQIPNQSSTFKSLMAIDPKERIYRFTETFRGHCGGTSRLGDMTVVEEFDRFVITHNPCGSGGRLRRTGKYGSTQKAYAWSWGKTGVPYYCTHCCIFWELTAIEYCGYPLRIHENVDKPQEPCIQYIYKQPELIPDNYFTRVGLKRIPSKFNKFTTP